MSEQNQSNYDRAIEAYQFQVKRYNTWMNYHALFQGALLVAFYSNSNFSENSASCSQCMQAGNANIATGLHEWLLVLIATLGICAGICWCFSVIGNKNWINSWIKIVQDEGDKNPGQENNIYKKVLDNGWMFSTQKILVGFTIVVILAWVGALSYLCYHACLKYMLMFLVPIVLTMTIYKYGKSNIEDMTKISHN